MNDYKDLKVWQESIDLVEEVYKLTNSFPNSETFALANQLRRAAVSVPSNISEGASRQSTKEFIHFLYIALGSAAEIETQAIIAQRLDYIKNSNEVIEKITKIRKMLNALISSLKKNKTMTNVNNPP